MQATRLMDLGNYPPVAITGRQRRINESYPDLIDFISGLHFGNKNDQCHDYPMTISRNLTGTLTTVYGNDGSYQLRQAIKKTGTKEYYKDLETGYTDIKVSNEHFDSLEKPDFPLTLQYDLDFKNFKNSDLIYFDPVLVATYKTNPLKNDTRLYPVEWPYKIDNLYLLTMEIPDGFQIDEVPKSTRVMLNETQGVFEYIFQKNPNNLQLRIHIKLNQANYSTEDYSGLRDFFAYVVKKESEQVVFKKIK